MEPIDIALIDNILRVTDLTTDEKYPNIGVVVIGRNEGERLVRCLQSLQDWMVNLVYVDSGSTDESVEVGRKAGAILVELDNSLPFTAARARNMGVQALRKVADFSFVQFVDGDCEVAPNWIPTACLYLEQHCNVAVVAGRLREKAPELSIYNCLCGIEWNVPVGETQTVGGIAMYRMETFLATGMFDSSLVAGEEPELCLRLRKNGLKIMRIEEEMAVHDANILKFHQWWRRLYKAGYGSLDVFLRLYGRVPASEIPFYGMVRSVPRWTLYWAGGTLGLTILGATVTTQYGALGGGIVGFGIWLTQAVRTAWGVRHRTKAWRSRLAYGVLTLIGKWAQLAGQYRYWKDHRATRSNLK